MKLRIEAKNTENWTQSGDSTSKQEGFTDESTRTIFGFDQDKCGIEATKDSNITYKKEDVDGTNPSEELEAFGVNMGLQNGAATKPEFSHLE